MNKERYNQIIDEVYNEYAKSFENQSIVEQHSFDTDPITKEMFIEKIKFFGEFSERWGLKIEERELSWEQRNNLCVERCLASGDGLSGSAGPDGINYEFYEELFAKYNVPKRAITLTYQNESIQSYE